MAIDLEHFPTNETALRMMERISPIYDRSYIGKWLFEIMGMEMGEARAYFEELRQQPFPERTTWAIEYWERRYAITPKPTDDLETRRRNIIMKRGARLPMNPARMEQIVDTLTGGTSTVTENVDDYTFSVTIDGAALGMNMPQVIKEIRRKKPSHQNFEYSVVLQANEHPELRLGGLMASAVCLPMPQISDYFCFKSTIHTGGHLNSIVRQPIPAVEDAFKFRRTIYLGGRIAAAPRLPTPAIKDQFIFHGSVQAGGGFSPGASFPVPNLLDGIGMTYTGRVGGRTMNITTIPVPELPAN